MKGLWRELSSFPSRWKELGEALKDPTTREALERAMTRFAHARSEALVDLGDFQEWSKRCRELKERALERADELWAQVREGVEGRGGRFYMAPSEEEARKYIGEAVQSA